MRLHPQHRGASPHKAQHTLNHNQTQNKDNPEHGDDTCHERCGVDRPAWAWAVHSGRGAAYAS